MVVYRYTSFIRFCFIASIDIVISQTEGLWRPAEVLFMPFLLFPAAFAHFLSLCHSLVILRVFQTFIIIILAAVVDVKCCLPYQQTKDAVATKPSATALPWGILRDPGQKTKILGSRQLRCTEKNDFNTELLTDASSFLINSQL